MKHLSGYDAIQILRKALYEVKDAPISREEMIQVADKALAKCAVIEYPVSPTVQWGVAQTPADLCEHGIHGTDCLDCYPVGTTKG